MKNQTSTHIHKHAAENCKSGVETIEDPSVLNVVLAGILCYGASAWANRTVKKNQF